MTMPSKIIAWADGDEAGREIPRENGGEVMAAIEFNIEYHRHIADTHADRKGKSLCGEALEGLWHYKDIDHAFFSAPKDMMQPCPVCAASIIKTFSECA